MLTPVPLRCIVSRIKPNVFLAVPLAVFNDNAICNEPFFWRGFALFMQSVHNFDAICDSTFRRLLTGKVKRSAITSYNGDFSCAPLDPDIITSATDSSSYPPMAHAKDSVYSHLLAPNTPYLMASTVLAYFTDFSSHSEKIYYEHALPCASLASDAHIFYSWDSTSSPPTAHGTPNSSASAVLSSSSTRLLLPLEFDTSVSCAWDSTSFPPTAYGTPNSSASTVLSSFSASSPVYHGLLHDEYELLCCPLDPSVINCDQLASDQATASASLPPSLSDFSPWLAYAPTSNTNNVMIILWAVVLSLLWLMQSWLYWLTQLEPMHSLSTTACNLSWLVYKFSARTILQISMLAFELFRPIPAFIRALRFCLDLSSSLHPSNYSTSVMLLFLVNIIGCAQAGGVNPPLFSGARLSYHTWLPNLIIYLTLKYPDLVAIVRKMHILPPQANPATDENTAARERFFRLDLQLYGAVLACMPQHLILSLTNMNTDSGLEVLARLASEFGISGASDRSEAINMVHEYYITNTSKPSIRMLRAQYDNMLLGNKLIAETGGQSYDDDTMKAIFDKSLPGCYNTIKRFVVRANHARFFDHYNDYISILKSESRNKETDSSNDATSAFEAMSLEPSTSFAAASFLFDDP